MTDSFLSDLTNLSNDTGCDPTDLCPSTSSACAVMSTSIAIDGGIVEFTGLTPGSEAMYLFTCQEGYGLEGDTNRTCQEDLRWSGETPHYLKLPGMVSCHFF